MPVRIQEGGLYKELSAPQVFVIHDGRKIHIPTEDALFALGYSWGEVASVPDGALDAFPNCRIESASRTPGSLVFPPVGADTYFAKRISTAQRIKARTAGADELQLVEIRGWLVRGDLSNVNDDGTAHSEPPGFDLGFGLIPDYRWLESQGININSLIMVGNFTLSIDQLGGFASAPGLPLGSGSTNDKVVRVTPVIKCEVNSWLWKGRVPPNLSSPPDDWIQFAPPGQAWPFLPDVVEGQYVSVHGSLVTDVPHSGPFSSVWNPAGKVPREIDKWSPGWPWAYPGEGRDHLARWTEIHPVDLIRPQADPGRHETVYGLLLTSNVNDCNSMTAILAPLTPRPPNTVAAYKELIGSESRDPNNDPRRHYVRVTKSADFITVVANTCGDAVGSHGRIKALYRLS